MDGITYAMHMSFGNCESVKDGKDLPAAVHGVTKIRAGLCN